MHSTTLAKSKYHKVPHPLVSIVAHADYTMPGCGAHLRFDGLELAVGLHSALCTVDHTSSTTCRYLPGCYTGTKLYCLVIEVWREALAPSRYHGNPQILDGRLEVQMGWV